MDSAAATRTRFIVKETSSLFSDTFSVIAILKRSFYRFAHANVKVLTEHQATSV